MKQTIDSRQEEIDELQKQLSMSKDSVNTIMKLEKQIKEKETVINFHMRSIEELRNEILILKRMNDKLDVANKQLQSDIEM
jgi:chromosome segregation ATPase